MYHNFYKLTALPFENTADPRFFFPSEQHQEAVAAIEYTIRVHKGFSLVTGDVGAGKTMVGQTLMDRCSDKARFVQVLHGHEEGLSLLRQSLRALGVRLHRSDDRPRLLERLRDRLTDQMAQHRPVVFVVDEAQTLGDGALEELRLLSNFDTARDKLVQVILIGQPELRDRLRSQRLAALRQRIVLAKHLRAFTPVETAAYIAHRLRAASADPNSVQVGFDGSAIAEIFRFTLGVPRLINTACDNSLLLGFVRGLHQIDGPAVRRSIEDMTPNLADPTWAHNDLQPSTLSLTGT